MRPTIPIVLKLRYSFDLEPKWLYFGSKSNEGTLMPTTLTLKNIPDALYDRLKTTAAAHRRSLNSEVLVCLETALFPHDIMPSERLARARALRAGLPHGAFDVHEMDTIKRAGRP